MSDEENATTIINCMASCAFAFFAMGVLDSYLFMMIAAANTLKPSDPLSLMWNVVFMGMAFSALAMSFRFLTMLFFPDTVKNGMKDSEMTTYMLLPGKADVKIVTNTREAMATVATMVIKLNQQETNTDAATTTKESTTQIPTNEVCAECPGTPESEISRADTVKCEEKMAKE